MEQNFEDALLNSRQNPRIRHLNRIHYRRFFTSKQKTPIAPIFSVVLICFSGLQAATIADSVGQFSPVQGQDNWFYGYSTPTTGSDFVQMPSYGFYNSSEGDAWFIDPSTASPRVYTHLSATGAHPNANLTSEGRPIEQWAVRRWVSSVNATIQIDGLFGDEDPNGDFGTVSIDGVIGEILVDGTPVWSLTTNGSVPNAAYELSAQVTLGSTVDFVLKPRYNDYSDQSTFTAKINVPEPSTTCFLGVGLVALLVTRRTERSSVCLSQRGLNALPKAGYQDS